MNVVTLKRWTPVVVYTALTISILGLLLSPYHRKARLASARTEELAAELEDKIKLLEQLPGRQRELKGLATDLAKFRSSLHRTDEVDEIMNAFKARATAAGITLWILNPSLSDLIAFDTGSGSVAQLDLAVLPVYFECRGDYVSVGRFLEAEENRSEFCAWERLTITGDAQHGGVLASGRATLFLLPAASLEVPAT